MRHDGKCLQYPCQFIPFEHENKVMRWWGEMINVGLSYEPLKVSGPMGPL